jgi:hypothetical protein
VARYQLLLWQDVPTVIKAFDDDGKATSRELPEWYQQEVDRRAMAQGLIGSDAYLEQWGWGELQDRPGGVEDVLDAVEAEVEAEFRPRRSEG